MVMKVVRAWDDKEREAYYEYRHEEGRQTF